MTNPVSQHKCHEPAAQLLAKADHSILGPRVNLQIEALSRNDVVNQLLTVVLDLGGYLLLQFRVPDEGLYRGYMVVADVLDYDSGLVEDLGLRLFVVRRCGNAFQALVDLEKAVARRRHQSVYRPGFRTSFRHMLDGGYLTHRLVVPVTFLPVLRAEQMTTTLLDCRLVLVCTVSTYAHRRGGLVLVPHDIFRDLEASAWSASVAKRHILHG